MVERRAEVRIAVDAPAQLTPLVSVSTRLGGQMVNVSAKGVRVRVAEQLFGEPRNGDVYRIHSGRDLMLGDICHWKRRDRGVDVGFRIIYWSEIGDLNRITKAQ